MRTEMETSNGLFQQQNQTQMAVDNDLNLFTQTHVPQNNNVSLNATTINNNESTVPPLIVSSVSSVAAVPAAASVQASSAAAVSSISNISSNIVVHEPPSNRLHSVLSNSANSSSSSSNSSPSIAAGLTQSHLKTTNHQQPATQNDPASQTKILTKTRLQELVREVDASEQLDDDVEEILLQLADDFVETTVTAACLLAKHRKASTVEVRDVQLHLERNWNMWIPGFGTDELRPYKRSAVTEAHKQRLALIRKTLKKY